MGDCCYDPIVGVTTQAPMKTLGEANEEEEVDPTIRERDARNMFDVLPERNQRFVLHAATKGIDCGGIQLSGRPSTSANRGASGEDDARPNHGGKIRGDARNVLDALPGRNQRAAVGNGTKTNGGGGVLILEGSSVLMTSVAMGQGGSKQLSESTSWADRVRGYSKPMTAKLHFIAPSIVDNKKVVVFSKDDLRKGAEEWKNTLVVHVVGRKPFYPHFVVFARRQWRPNGNMQVFTRENGFFLIKFGEEEDCKKVLEFGPWFYDGRPILMKQWHQNMMSEKEVLTKLPVWIRLPDLPIQFWTKEDIIKISSMVGTPIHMDATTASLQRISFARVFVEVTADANYCSEIQIQVEGGEVITQNVEYEWRPLRCSHCFCFGHSLGQCRSKSKKEWKHAQQQEEEDDKAKIVKMAYKIQAQANDDDEVDYEYLVDPIGFNRKLTFDLSHNDVDADVVVIAEKGPVALRDFPHPRHLCANFPFNTTSPESCCAQCFCYVCEIAAPCLQWAGTSRHCNVTKKPS